MKEDGAQNRILPFTFVAGIFGGALGLIITYPIQKLYSYKNPIWSEELIMLAIGLFYDSLHILDILNLLFCKPKRQVFQSRLVGFLFAG